MSDFERANTIRSQMAMIRQNNVRHISQLRFSAAKLIDWRSHLRERVVPLALKSSLFGIAAFTAVAALRRRWPDSLKPKPHELANLSEQAKFTRNGQPSAWKRFVVEQTTRTLVVYFVPWLTQRIFTHRSGLDEQGE